MNERDTRHNNGLGDCSWELREHSQLSAKQLVDGWPVPLSKKANIRKQIPCMLGLGLLRRQVDRWI